MLISFSSDPPAEENCPGLSRHHGRLGRPGDPQEQQQPAPYSDQVKTYHDAVYTSAHLPKDAAKVPRCVPFIQ